MPFQPLHQPAMRRLDSGVSPMYVHAVPAAHTGDCQGGVLCLRCLGSVALRMEAQQLPAQSEARTSIYQDSVASAPNMTVATGGSGRMPRPPLSVTVIRPEVCSDDVLFSPGVHTPGHSLRHLEDVHQARRGFSVAAHGHPEGGACMQCIMPGKAASSTTCVLHHRTEQLLQSFNSTTRHAMNPSQSSTSVC
jgi:hypothetical protein